MAGSFPYVKQRDLTGATAFIWDKDLTKNRRSEVRASVVAMKIRNGIGAKGRRVMDA
jgi:hypothetical protein